MVSSTIDHLVAVTIFLAATLLFIGLFNQTIQTAVIYQNHRSIATKASDLLDNMLLNPGTPINWGLTDNATTGFGIQDPEFTQYKISPFSLMRLASSIGTPVYYPKTGEYYSNITIGSKNFLLVSNESTIDYATAVRNLGINGSYGFQLSLTPVVSVEVTETHNASPLSFNVDVQGTGFPLANATVTYCLLTVDLNGGDGSYPAFVTKYGTAYTNQQGSVDLVFNEVTDSSVSYAIIAYARLGGLVGVGYTERVSSDKQYALPLVDSMSEGRILIAHSYDVHAFDQQAAEIKYNASFVFLAEDYTLRQIPLENSVGHVNYGDGKPYDVVNIPTDNPGILLITYRKSAVEGGIIMMPWGINSLSFPVVFGGDPLKQEWVATDMRQILVGNIAYQAKIAVWSLKGYQVNG
jgi:hypothetical protein